MPALDVQPYGSAVAETTVRSCPPCGRAVAAVQLDLAAAETFDDGRTRRDAAAAWLLTAP
jgi:hypothetical protein